MQRQAFDSEYVQKLAQCDPETERHFIDYFTELMYCKLRRRLRSEDQRRDVIQETFVRVFKVLRTAQVSNPEALGSFVNSVCNNVLFEVRRQRPLAQHEPEDRAGDEPLAEDEAVSRAERDEIRQVLAGLPERDRTILRWLYFEERDKVEICRKLKVDPEYLRVLLHRAKGRFRGIWENRRATKSLPSSPIG